ncbi:M36 family metallopeptidase [Micromonospora sp. M12]
MVFDSFLLQAASQVSMLDMRDNMLTADLLRFGGANQDLIWAEFARSGWAGTPPRWAPPTPTRRRASPRHAVATRRSPCAHAGQRRRADPGVRGAYEARAVPVADTDPATAIPDTVELVAGTYDLLAVAPASDTSGSA